MERKRNKPVTENFRDFLNGAELGGNGNRYEYGANPEEHEGTELTSDPKSVKNMLGFINDISNTALNVIENNNMSDADLESMVYVKRQIEKARIELVEGYRRLQDATKGRRDY